MEDRFMARWLPVLLVMSALVGCTHTVTEFSILSTKKVEPGMLATYGRTANPVQAEDTIHIVFVIPVELRGHDMNVAINKAIESVPGGVALVDGKIEESKFQIPFIYGVWGYHVEGKVLVNPAQR